MVSKTALRNPRTGLGSSIPSPSSSLGMVTRPSSGVASTASRSCKRLLICGVAHSHPRGQLWSASRIWRPPAPPPIGNASVETDSAHHKKPSPMTSSPPVANPMLVPVIAGSLPLAQAVTQLSRSAAAVANLRSFARSSVRGLHSLQPRFAALTDGSTTCENRQMSASVRFGCVRREQRSASSGRSLALRLRG